MITSRRLVLFVAVAAFVIALDQWTKILIRQHLRSPRVYARGLLTVVHTENTGAFLSLGANLPEIVRTLVFGGFVAVMLVAFAIAVIKGSIRGAGDTAAAAAIIAGGVGNLIDRLLRDGRVTDFLYLEAGLLHTGVFNVADMAITCGVIWLVLTSFKRPQASGPSPQVP